MSSAANSPLVLGVYSLTQKKEMGSGRTLVERRNITYWFVRQVSANQCELQPLSTRGLPSGVVTKTALKDVLHRYTPEPFYYSENPCPVLESMAHKVFESDSTDLLTSLDPSELECLRLILGKPADAPRTQQEKVNWAWDLREMLSVLLCRGEKAQFSHRARCSSHGVVLRKDKRYEESLGYFTKALELEKNDENIYFNMARVYYDKGDLQQCRDALDKALVINPGFLEAIRFMRFLRKRA